eukprot:jgi/Tetstr1/460259/TSEL_005559.t1
MRGKVEELREEVDASMSKLLSAKPSRRYTHALHHHAWALLKHCMQHKAGYWLRNCLPSEVEAFAEAVDATILAAVERVLGVSFDPSTYGTDTNPVVTDFLAELLHDPDPMAAEVATLSEDAVARARSRLHLPTRLKGAGIRRMATVRDAAFIGCMNAILPRFLTRNSGTNTPTHGFFDPQLGSVLGRGSFNANSSARQYDHFLNDAHGSDSYAAEMREAWARLQAATGGHLGDADARQMEREVEAASGSQKELTAFLDHANNSRLRNEVCALPATCRERILFNQLDAASGMWTVAIPTARTAMTPHELREVAAGYFFLPSPCLGPVVGCQNILPSTERNPVIVDLYGDALMNLPAHGDAHWRVQHDAIADAFRDHCVHDLGIAVRREVDDLFQQALPLGNTVPRDELKDLVLDAELSLPVFNVVTGSYDPRSLKSTLLEFKTMRYGVKYTGVPRATAVDRFERSLLGDIQRGLAARDAAWHNTEPGQKGPLRDILDMSEYTGMVFGTVGLQGRSAGDSAQVQPPARWIETVSWEPRAYVYHGFLSHEEADHIVALAQPTMSRSSVIDSETGGAKLDGIRTSHGTFLKRKQDDVVADIERRLAIWTKIPEENGEDIQVLRYENGQEYGAHWDWFDDPVKHADQMTAGNRIATVLMYLSDVEEGGETAFPHGTYVNEAKQKSGQYSPCGDEGVAVRPKKGDALLFWDLTPDAKEGDKYSLHAGCPVLRGTKWSATKWIHVRPFNVLPVDLPAQGSCRDDEMDCEDWAGGGECEKNPAFMHVHCKYSCGKCENA